MVSAAPPPLATPAAPGPPRAPADWEHWGRVAPQPLGGGRVRLVQNTSLVSAPIWLPRRAQVLELELAATPGMATVEVVARREADGAEVSLAVIEPGRAMGTHTVGLAPVAGEAVRLLIEPTPVLGGGVDVGRIGPLREPLAGWGLLEGAPRALPAAGGVIATGTEPLRATSAHFRPPADAVALRVEARGEGVLRLTAAGRRTTAAVGRSWRAVELGVRRGVRQRLEILADPRGGEDLRLRRLGTYVFRVRATGLVRRGARVSGRLVPRGAGLQVRLRTAGGALLAGGRSDRRGRVALAVPAGVAPSARLVLEVTGDAQRRGARLGVGR